MRKIISPRNKKTYNADDIKVVSYTMPDKNGINNQVKCVELTIIGNNHSWKDWFYYDDFAKINPGITIEEDRTNANRN